MVHACWTSQNNKRQWHPGNFHMHKTEHMAVASRCMHAGFKKSVNKRQWRPSNFHMHNTEFMAVALRYMLINLQEYVQVRVCLSMVHIIIHTCT